MSTEKAIVVKGDPFEAKATATGRPIEELREAARVKPGAGAHVQQRKRDEALERLKARLRQHLSSSRVGDR